MKTILKSGLLVLLLTLAFGVKAQELPIATSLIYYTYLDEMNSGLQQPCELLRAQKLMEARAHFDSQYRQSGKLSAFIGLAQSDPAFRSQEMSALLSKRDKTPAERYRLVLLQLYNYSVLEKRFTKGNLANLDSIIKEMTALYREIKEPTLRAVVGLTACQAWDLKPAGGAESEKLIDTLIKDLGVQSLVKTKLDQIPQQNREGLLLVMLSKWRLAGKEVGKGQLLDPEARKLTKKWIDALI